MERAPAGSEDWVRLTTDPLTAATYTDSALEDGAVRYRVLAEDEFENFSSPSNEAPALVYTPLLAVSLMVFYVFALMCISTVAVTVREAGGGREGWKWAGIQFAYMLALAYLGAWLVQVGGRALGYGG